jgi:hypothetical protein
MSYKIRGQKAIVISILFFFTLFIFESCSKDSHNGDNNSSGYYLSATINGTAWSANVNSSLNNSPVVAALTTNSGVSVFILLGIKAVSKDTTAIAVIFPQNATLNNSYNFDASSYSEAAYVEESAPGSPTYFGYNTLPATGGSGNFTITSFDQTAMTIEGNFSGTLGSQNGKPALKVTNGKFRCPYTTNINELPKGGGLKF